MLNDNSGVTPATLNTTQRTYLQTHFFRKTLLYIYIIKIISSISSSGEIGKEFQ